MPRAILPRARFNAALARSPSDEELRELLWPTKAELAEATPEHVTVEATADRLDLLTESGLAAALAPRAGGKRGLVPVRPAAPSAEPPAFDVDASVDPIRPAIAGVVLEAPEGHALDAGLLDEAIRFQELLHATYGRDRRRASLGIYATERFRFPVRYTAKPAHELRFVPLDGTDEVDGAQFLRDHPMAAKYGALGTSGRHLLVLEDPDGRVLSVPPILNARPAGEAKPGDRSLLIESTGATPSRVQETVGLLSLVFVANGWSVRPVAVRRAAGTDDGRSVVAPRGLVLRLATLDALAGRSYAVPEVEHLLAEARLGAHPVAGGFSVEVPPWRPDLIAEVDLAEEVVLGRGVRAEDGVAPPSPTRGRRRAETVFRRRIAELLLGLGHAELCTPLLVGREVDLLLAPSGAIEVANPVSDLFSHVRNRLLPSLLTSLGRNLRHPYPQRVFEVGPAIVRDPSAETGGRTVYRAGALLAGEGAGFADAAGLLDYLTGTVAAIGVREPAEIPGTIAGRAARLRLAGEAIGELGEVHPRVLAALGVPFPVAWAELDLSALWPLVRRASEAPM